MRDRIGPFRLQHELGRGGMGVVYAATDEAGREVALKVLPLGGAAPTRLERFERESEALARLRHAHVIPVHAAGTADGFAYYAMPRVPGGSLADRVEARGPLSTEDAVTLGVALCEALQAAHEVGILHRDLKPANVLFGADGTPLLADFGLARAIYEAEALTRSGAFVGSPGYMSPEQARGDRDAQGPATDVYGVAATLYFAVCGEPPITGDTLAGLLVNTQDAAPRPPSSVNANASITLGVVLLNALSKQPSRRPPSAAALGRALAGCTAGQPRRRSPWPLVAAGAGLCALALSAWAVLPRPTTEASPPAPPPEPVTEPTQPATDVPEVPQGEGEVPWERGGLPELDLSLREALAAARGAVIASKTGEAAMYYACAARLGAGRGSSKLTFESEYTEALSRRLRQLHDDGWPEESEAVATRVIEIAAPYWKSEFTEVEEFAQATMFQVQLSNAYYHRALHARARDQLDEAFRELDCAIRVTPDSERVIHLRAELLAAQGKAEESQAQLTTCCLSTKREPGHGERARLALGLAWLAAGQKAQAQPHLEFARDHASHPSRRHRAACALDPLGQRAAEEVVADWSQRGASSRDVAGYVRCGNAYTTLNRLNQAVNAYAVAATLDPQCAEAWVGIAEARVLQHWDDGRLITAGQALSRMPTHRALGLAYVATGYRFAGRNEEVESVAREALRLDPKLALSTRVAFDLGLALLDLDQLDGLSDLIDLLYAGPPYRRNQAQQLNHHRKLELERRAQREAAKPPAGK